MLMKIIKSIPLISLLIFLFSSCEDIVDKSVLRVLAPIAIFSLLGLILQPLIRKLRKRRRVQYKEEVENEKLITDDILVSNKNQPINTDEISARFEIVVQTKLPLYYQVGCLFIALMLLVSWFGFLFGGPIFGLLLFSFLFLTCFWLALYGLVKKVANVVMEFEKNKIIFFNSNGIKLFDFNYNEISYLRLYETHQNVKGIKMYYSGWMVLWMNENEISRQNVDKLNSFKNIFCKNRIVKKTKNKYLEGTLFSEDLAIQWPINYEFEGKSLRKALFQFCNENSIVIKNDVGYDL